MIAAWMIYALLVGVLVGGGALALESLLRAHRLPVRGVWIGAMALSVAWPLSHILRDLGPAPSAPPPLPDPAWVVALDPLAVQVGPASMLHRLDGPILVAWLCASILLLGLALLLLLRTHWLRKRWTGEEAGGRAVLLSEDWGPAVVGFLRPQIVLPAWCRELEDEALALILDHEAEHLRAGDLRLLLAAAALPVLLPWHLALWWQLGRLKAAVEGDCDLRVLRRHPGRTRSYLELLLEVGRRPAPGRFAGAMLTESEETLERRIRTMTMPFPKKPWVRALFLGSVGTALIAVACWAPEPTGSEVDELVAPVEEAVTASSQAQTRSGEIQLPPTPEEIRAGTGTPLESKTPEELQSAPTFTPYTVRPDIKNRETVARALEREYPPLLKDAGIGGTAHVWFFVDQDGRVGRTVVNESTGHKALDEAALRVASIIEFTPALNREKRVPVWISLPITFSAREGAAPEGSPRPPELEKYLDRVTAERETTEPSARPELPPPPGELTRSREEIAAAPTFTPYTVRPDIRNRNDVALALQDAYPTDLRDAGIGGTAQVWFFIDEMGRVQRLQINQSSGNGELDAAALGVAAMIEFTPALKDDKPVPVWISLPITFTTR